MAKLCIRIGLNNNLSNSELDIVRTQVGDIVCIVEDDHVFSSVELNCGQYRFINIPGILKVDLLFLIEPILDVDEQIIRIRNITLNKDILKSDQWKNRTSATKAQIEAIIVTKV